MRFRWLVLAWLVIGLVVWVGVFGLYVEHGVQRYLRLLAEFEAGLGPEPSLTGVMAGARARGVLYSSLLAGFVSGAGVATVWYAGSRR